MRALILSFSVIILYCCKTTNHLDSKNKISNYCYVYKIPFYTNDGILSYFGDSTPFYYLKDIVIYQLPYEFSSSVISPNDDDSSFNEISTFREKRYKYFVFRRESKYGLFYDSLTQQTPTRKLADSIYILKFGEKNSSSDTDFINTILIPQQNEKVFLRKSFPKKKKDGYPDSIYFYYSDRFNMVNFSLLPIIDTLINSRLYKTEMFFNGKLNKEDTIQREQSKIVMEFKENEKRNLGIEKLFERFQSDELKFSTK